LTRGFLRGGANRLRKRSRKGERRDSTAVKGKDKKIRERWGLCPNVRWLIKLGSIHRSRQEGEGEEGGLKLSAW